MIYIYWFLSKLNLSIKGTVFYSKKEAFRFEDINIKSYILINIWNIIHCLLFIQCTQHILKSVRKSPLTYGSSRKSTTMSTVNEPSSTDVSEEMLSMWQASGGLLVSRSNLNSGRLVVKLRGLNADETWSRLTQNTTISGNIIRMRIVKSTLRHRKGSLMPWKAKKPKQVSEGIAFQALWNQCGPIILIRESRQVYGIWEKWV